ncbi:cytochrome P450 [Wolfiporia cocos MD-104 SS10]|uniref:Cytochrome P450 n=1 Tax=Wolfiporia cocos (strain MD-104) TaxID=742152 RepID=A0A2H3JIH4_WOLCO|nr:cytochrome P450 [Wolfiporia cocos MD-104 SS10]
MEAFTLFGLSAVLASLFFVFASFWFCSQDKIRGPPSPSFLYGHSIEITREDDVGQYHVEWMNEFGWAWRLRECLGKDNLWFADPRAIQHIFNKSGPNYARRTESKYISRQLMGESILCADGYQHSRMRRIMEPAFGTAQLRSFTALFRDSARKLSKKWREQLDTADSETDSIINISRWFSRASLDVIGEAAFEYDCGALDDGESELVRAYRNMLRDSIMYPSRIMLVFRSTWQYLPDFLLRLIISYLPTREYRRIHKSLGMINSLSRRLIDEKSQLLLDSRDLKRRDIMSLLVKANNSENPKTRLTDEEMVAQVATFLLAGHETSANALTWLLWELAKNPICQHRLREEIAAVRADIHARGGSDFTAADLESMLYLNATIKEGLRLHPLVYLLVRTAQADDVIPLSRPVMTSSGRSISEIHVQKGQNVSVSVWAYQRLPEIWGDDANQFNPDRFLRLDKERQINLGTYANLMAFGGGRKACLGWRFAVFEIQTFLVEIIENFKFAIPADKPDIQRVPAGVMIPMIRGKMVHGSQMPLHITPTMAY